MLYIHFGKMLDMAVKGCVKGKKVYIVSIDKYGRITIPKEIRDKLNSGTFILELLADNRIILEPLDLDR